MTDFRIPTVALRTATDDDAPVLRDLSGLDSAPDLERPAVLAVVDDEPVAAISLADGRVVADPFERTAESSSCCAGAPRPEGRLTPCRSRPPRAILRAWRRA